MTDEERKKFIYIPPPYEGPKVKTINHDEAACEEALNKLIAKRSKDIEGCKSCQDESYPDRHAHYIYLDDKDPKWTCCYHPEFYRKLARITDPQWVINFKDQMMEVRNDEVD